MKKYKIGITFNLESKINDIWANGANQNLIFLYDLFARSEIVEKVYLVSWGATNEITPPKGFMLDNMDINYAQIMDVIDELDVLIEGGLTVEPMLADRMHQHGGKVVCYKMGADYIADIESFSHEKQPNRTFNGSQFDAVWLIPQQENICRAYLGIILNAPVSVVPAIWAPTFCDMIIKSLKEKANVEFGYKPGDENKKFRMATFEPNASVVKSCFTPILICEQAYRTDSTHFKHLYITNVWYKKDHPTFRNLLRQTKMLQNGVLSVEARYQLPDFLARYVDIVVSNQWENGLNYAYNDALYGGYPLIHNSKLLPKGVGYYYDQFDAYEGAKVLLDVMKNHDKNHQAYTKRAKEYLDSLLPTNPINIYLYETEVKKLFK